MMRPLALGFAILLAAAALSVAAAAIVMSGDGFDMGDHMRGMMGGRGSDPAEEAPVAGVTQVRVEDFAFSPANIVIDAGTTVTWTNYDSIGHTVTSDEDGALDSPLFGENETFSHTFAQPGAFPYHCEPHPNMRGLVTVRPPGEG